jgi:AraC-like DNA-binding protein
LERHPAVALALAEFDRGAPTVGQVMDRIGLSRRRIIQVFTEQVGLTPKLYCRIQRFQQALRRVHRRKTVDWVQVALDCGYYDQAHFVHDFQAFSGLNPSAYLQQQGDHLNHVPLVD